MNWPPASGRSVAPTAAETLAAIIREDPEPLPPSVPAPLRWVVERCLAKDPAERYDSTRDLYRELKLARDRLSEASGSQAAPAPRIAVRGCARGEPRLWRGSRLPRSPFGHAVPDPPLGAAVVDRRDARWARDGAQPAASPDGHLLAFEAIVDGLSQMAVMKPESGNWSVLTHDRDHGPLLNHCGPRMARSSTTTGTRTCRRASSACRCSAATSAWSSRMR